MTNKILKILFSILIGLMPYIMVSQSWNGTEKWLYKMDDYYPYSEFDSYHEINITGDTVINNQDCFILEEFSLSVKSGIVEDTFPYSTYYMNYENGIIIKYNEWIDNFIILYDFNKQENECFVSFCEFSHLAFQTYIDSITNFQSNSLNLKRFHISPKGYDAECIYEDEVIEEIGSINYFFPLYTTVDPPLSGRLICYTKNGIPNEIGGTCGNLVSNTHLENRELVISPNPFQDRIHITYHSSLEFLISNSQGRVLKEGIINGPINTSDLNAGIYFLTLIDKNRTKQTQKIIKSGY